MQQNNQKLILLVGPSGSGKTTVARELEKEGYNVIHSYTTRPPRKPNEWGHIFISEKEYLKHVTLADEDGTLAYKDSEMIAFQELYGEYYFATKEQYQGKGTSIYVIDPSGVEDIYKNVNDAEVITIFLMADENTRYRRMFRDRGWGAVERIKQDKEIFKTCKCDYVVDTNRKLPEVLADIKEIIGGIR